MKAVPVILLALLLACGRHSEPEIHLIPRGYVGQVYILFGIPTGEPPVREGARRIYRIPRDGVLLTQAPSNPGWSWRGEVSFVYQEPSGAATPISERWVSTIHDTPENRSNPTIGVFGGGLGVYWSQAVPCQIQYQSYFVGRKADVLNGREPTRDFDEYLLRRHFTCP